MADNTRQWNWMTFIKNGLEETTANQNIFVAGDLLWYPVEGNNKFSVAPDVMVAIGRPKGHRNSYLQWNEDHIAPQIVFEILSHSNTQKEMKRKLQLYETYDVIEYYVYDPKDNQLEIYNRTNNKLVQIKTKDWTSPLLKFRLLWTQKTLKLYHPNGSPFLSYAEVIADVKSVTKENIEIKTENTEIKAENIEVKVENTEIKAENIEVKAENQRIKAEAAAAKLKAAALAAKLKALGINPDSIS